MRSLLPLALLPCVALLAGAVVQAQSRATAEQGVRVQTYVLATYARPDFGGARRNGGGTLGFNLNVGRVLGRLDPSLDLRALGTGGRVSNQYFYGAGPRVVASFDRLQPFAEFLIGDGIIHFPAPADPSYTHDHCFAKAYGGGADFRVTRGFAVRGEFLRQNWQLSHRAAPFHPEAISVGLRYQFRFRGRGGPDL